MYKYVYTNSIQSLKEAPSHWDEEPCPYCGGKVIYTNNSVLYHGTSYGNGCCYYCTNCHASVGVHSTGDYKTPLGILATREMRPLKMKAHRLFDKYWRVYKYDRNKVYRALALEMGIEPEQCHFGWFSTKDLRRAIHILQDWDEHEPHFMHLYKQVK